MHTTLEGDQGEDMSLDSFSGRAPRPRSDFEIALLDVEVGFTGKVVRRGTDKDIILSYLALASRINLVRPSVFKPLFHGLE